MTELLELLASQNPATQPAPQSGLMTFMRTFFPIILVIGIFMWIMSRGKKKERERFQNMLNNLKRNDRVMTIGGVIGTVVDTRDDEVVLKVDEASNVKMRFSKMAIKGLVGETPPPESQG
jgi:preprotein translocase subunit YajC